MKRFVEGVDRGQSTLFPECLPAAGQRLITSGTRMTSTLKINKSDLAQKTGLRIGLHVRA